MASKIIIRRDFVPWAKNCNNINNRLEKWIIPCNTERNITPKEKLSQQLVSLFFLILSIEVIDGCEPGVVLGTKNDEVATRLVIDIDAEVEPMPFPYSPPNTLPTSSSSNLLWSLCLALILPMISWIFG